MSETEQGMGPDSFQAEQEEKEKEEAEALRLKNIKYEEFTQKEAAAAAEKVQLAKEELKKAELEAEINALENTIKREVEGKYQGGTPEEQNALTKEVTDLLRARVMDRVGLRQGNDRGSPPPSFKALQVASEFAAHVNQLVNKFINAFGLPPSPANQARQKQRPGLEKPSPMDRPPVTGTPGKPG